MEGWRLASGWYKGLMAIAWMVASSAPVQAQVGLGSGVARVTLMAHAPPHGSIQGVGAQRDNGLVGGIRELSVSVRMSANTGYRLQVRRMGAPGMRIWVRTSAGDFEELLTDAAVTVAGGNRAHHGDREVHYRIEAAEAVQPVGPLPVRYEIAINPML